MTESHRPAPDSGRGGAFKPLIFIAAVFFGVGAIFLVARLATPGEKIPWQSDLARARLEAAESRKQVFVYFTADWCGPCQEMKRTVFSDAEVDRALRFHVPVKIDIDDQPVLAKMYKVESIPFFAILDGDGEIELSASGKMTSQELIAWIKRASKQGMPW